MKPVHVRRFLDHTGAAGDTADDFDEPVERRLSARTVVLHTVEVDGYGVVLLAEYESGELTAVQATRTRPTSSSRSPDLLAASLVLPGGSTAPS